MDATTGYKFLEEVGSVVRVRYIKSTVASQENGGIEKPLSFIRSLVLPGALHLMFLEYSVFTHVVPVLHKYLYLYKVEMAGAELDRFKRSGASREAMGLFLVFSGEKPSLHVMTSVNA